MISEKENINKIDLKLKTKETIEKAKKIIDIHKTDTGDCDIEVSLAYDMQYVKKYIDQLELEKDTLRFIQWCDTDRINQLEQENNKLNKMIDEMAEYIVELIKVNNCEELRETEEIKQYFEKKVDENDVKNKK